MNEVIIAVLAVGLAAYSKGRSDARPRFTAPMAEERVERTRYVVPKGITQVGHGMWIRFPRIPLGHGREGIIEEVEATSGVINLTLRGEGIVVTATFDPVSGTYADVTEVAT